MMRMPRVTIRWDTWHTWYEAAFAIADDSTMKLQNWSRPFQELTFLHSPTHFVWKGQHVALRLSTKIWAHAAPARKSDTPTSPKCCACHEKSPYNVWRRSYDTSFTMADDSSISRMIWPWNCKTEAVRSKSLLFFIRQHILYGKDNMSRSGYLPKFEHMLPLPGKVSDITKAAPATKSHAPTSPWQRMPRKGILQHSNVASATKSDGPILRLPHYTICDTNRMKGQYNGGGFETDPRMMRTWSGYLAPARSPRIPTSPNVVPAVTRDTQTSPNVALATKSEAPTSVSIARKVMWDVSDVSDVSVVVRCNVRCECCEWCVMWDENDVVICAVSDVVDVMWCEMWLMWVMCDVSDEWCCEMWVMWWCWNSVTRKFRNWTSFDNISMNKSDQPINHSQLFSVILGDFWLTRFEPPGVEEWQPELLVSTHLSRRNQVEVLHASPDGKVRNERAIKGPPQKSKCPKKIRNFWKSISCEFLNVQQWMLLFRLQMDSQTWTFHLRLSCTHPHTPHTFSPKLSHCKNSKPFSFQWSSCSFTYELASLKPHLIMIEDSTDLDFANTNQLRQFCLETFRRQKFQFHPWCLPPPLDRRSQEPDNKSCFGKPLKCHVFWNGLKFAGKETNGAKFQCPLFENSQMS